MASDRQEVIDKPAYVFGVFPFIPAARLEGIFAPLAKEFSLTLGGRVLYRSASTFETFMARLENKAYDIALIQPFDYVRLAVPAGYHPVARRWQNLQAIFAVRQDSDLKTVGDLAGKTISLPPEVSAVSYIGQATLVQAGMVPGKGISLDFTNGHHAALHKVVVGKSSAAVISKPALALFQANFDLELKILVKSEAIPQILFVVHDRVPFKQRQLIKQALLETNLTGVPLKLRSWMVKSDTKPFVEATDEDYRTVHRMWQELKKTK